MHKCLLDTDIFSEIIKKKNPSVIARAEEYLRFHSSYTISIFTVYEVLYGLYLQGKEHRIQQMRWAIEQQEILEFTPDAAEIAAKIESQLKVSGQLIGKIDPMIAAIAIANNLPLITGNGSHYERIRQLGYELKVENWR